MEKICQFKKCSEAYMNIRKKLSVKVESGQKIQDTCENGIIARRNRQICNHLAVKCIIVRLWSENISMEIEDF